MLSWVINSFLRLALLPVFTRYLETSEYGTLAMLDSAINLIRIICALGLSSAIIRFYHEYSTEQEKKKTISTGIVVLSFIAIASGWMLYLFRLPLTRLVLGDGGSVIYLCLCAATMVFGLIRFGTDAYLMAEKASVAFVVANSGQAILNAVINVYLVCVKELGVLGMLMGNLVATGIVNSILFAVILKKVSLNVDLRILQKMIKFSAPLVVSILAAAGMHELDRFFIRYYTSLAEVGLYSLAYQFPFMLNSIFVGSFDRIWAGSTMYEVARSPDAKYQYGRIATYYMALLGFAFFSLAVSSRAIVRTFAASDYIGAAKYIPIIALGVWFYAFHVFVKIGVLLTKKTYLFSVNYCIALFVNIVVNFLLVPSLGAMGAAIATVATYAYFSLGGFYIYRRSYPMEFEWKRLATIFIVGIILTCLRKAISSQSFYKEIITDMIFIAMYPAILAFFPGFLTDGEKSLLKIWIRDNFVKIFPRIKLIK